jgi:hypothetical protein
MNWKLWQNWHLPGWLTKYINLLEENQKLQNQLEHTLKLLNSMYYANKFNVIHAERVIEEIRQEEVSLLGGIALQFQGEILIKNDFIQMLKSPDYSLQVIIEPSEEKEGVYVRVVELPAEEEKKTDAEDKK